MPNKSIDLVLDMKVSLAKKGKADLCDVLLVFDGIPSDWLDDGPEPIQSFDSVSGKWVKEMEYLMHAVSAEQLTEIREKATILLSMVPIMTIGVPLMKSLSVVFQRLGFDVRLINGSDF